MDPRTSAPGTAPLYINHKRVNDARFPMANNDGDYVVSYVNGRRKVYVGLGGKLAAPRSFDKILARRQSTPAVGGAA